MGKILSNVDKGYSVVKSHTLIGQKFGDFSETEAKIVLSLITNIEKEEKLGEKKSIHFDEIGFEAKNRNSIYRSIRNGTMDLMNRKAFPLPDKTYVHWFSSINVENNTLTYRMDPDLEEHLVDLKNKFIKYKLKNIMSLKKIHSIYIYEVLKYAFEEYRHYHPNADSYEYNVDFEDLKEKCFKDSYSNSKIKEAINMAKRELEQKTDITFDYSINKFGNKFKDITFNIKRNIPKPTMPNETSTSLRKSFQDLVK